MADETPANEKEKTLADINSRFRDEVNEANFLLEWAVSVGKDVKPELVEKIKGGQSLLLVERADIAQRAAFESAYNELTKLTSPVTWTTLRATSDRYGKKTWLAPFRRMRGDKISHARVWSRILWFWTFLFLFLILMGENLQDYLDTFLPADSEALESAQSIEWSRLTFWFSKIVAFLYGGLGACAFLLRSCHKFIYERTFDPRRLPEYYNRIFLGFLAGGTILLFISPESTPEKVSAAALAFLAGYSTDFLYTTIERVAGALLPKKAAGS